MKRLYTLVTVSMLFLLATVALCSAVLISVELPTIESKKAWHQLGIPTYELISNTAVAEAEEQQISSIKQKGYIVSIIDEIPDLAKYTVVADMDKLPEMKLETIWQKGKTAIVKTGSKNIIKDGKFNHKIRSMNTSPLGERFWKSLTAVYIPCKSISYDPFIQSLVDQVNADSIAANIQRMQDFSTREMLSDSGFAASAWLANKYADMGLNGQLDSFYFVYPYNPLVLFGWEQNALGTKPGRYSKTIITGGHLDTASDSLGCAPGADDDASGVAGAMEIARIMKNYSWDATMLFAGWAGEECGEGVGSTHYAKSADSIGQNIVGVVNLDMIGYMSDSVLQCAVFCGHLNSIWLIDLFVDAGKQYVPAIAIEKYFGDTHCDSYFFSLEGYPAITAIDAGYNNPYAHTAYDLLSTLSSRSYVAFTQTALATMVLMDRFPASVESVIVKDVGTGDKLWVGWTLNEESNVNSYRIYWGRQSGVYSDSAESDTSSFEISGLMADTAYYITVRAVNDDDYVSPMAYEEMGIPRIAPLTPSGITAKPVFNAVTIQWKKNEEQDLYCYRLYKRINEQAISDSVDMDDANDTLLADSSVSGNNKYYYWLRAIDTDGNCSPLSDSVYCRPITLDQGVLVVDETQNWTTGSFPSDAQQDTFYNYLMDGYKYEQYEFGSVVQKPVLADFVPYSSVLWHCDDPSAFLAYNDSSTIREYLAYGGKLWFIGWKPTGDIRNSTIYPFDFSSGSLLYDYFKISRAEISGSTDSLIAVQGLSGYPAISVDSAKVPIASFIGTMKYIEALSPLAGADTIYVMDMKNDSSAFEGRACAVRDSGKTVFFGFPLYFMDKDQARLAAQQVMAEFGEVPLGVAGKPENKERIAEGMLLQNAPNPFKHQTSINYQLPKAGQVRLNIYNIAGQLVRTLVNGEHLAGKYAVKWNRQDDHNRQVSAGVYIYHLSTDGKTQSRKMIVLK